MRARTADAGALVRRRSGVQFPPAALFLTGAREFTTPPPRGLRETADVGPRGDNVCELHLAFLPRRGVVGVVLEPDPVEVQCRVRAPLEPGERAAIAGMEAVPDPASPGKAGAEMVLLRAVNPESELAVGRGHRVVQFHHRLDAHPCVEGCPQASVLQEIVSPV